MQELSSKISKTLRALRKQRGWSLDKAAAETGVSKAMLGQIEREESSPTISTLWKIASGFQTSFSSFIEEPLAEHQSFIRRSEKVKSIHPKDDRIKVMTLFPFDADLKFEIFLIELSPGCEHLSPPHAKGVVEHVIAVKGKVEVFIQNRWQKLSLHEGLKFEASKSHGYRNLSREKAQIHDIIHYP